MTTRMTKTMRIGVEVGGTFTDLILERDGVVDVVKVPSTPARPDQGAIAAIDRCGVDLADLDDLVHGSTVVTNAILERKGAKLCLIVSRGIRDILLIQRHNRKRIYDLHYTKPDPVVRRRDTYEVTERLDAEGQVVTPLDSDAVARDLPLWFQDRGYEAVAICLLNSHRNPAHEQTLAALVKAYDPALSVTCSHEVNREFREYERCSTTTLSAYVQPVVATYLAAFAKAMETRHYAGPFSIMQSNGGRLPAAGMARNAISALFSGPAAGVMGAVSAAGASGHKDLVTFDMGGTSTDVCLVNDGQPALTGMVEIDGLPIKTPVVDMVTVGAGGGSIVWIDDGGMLRVGPQSAGADPGPACYGRGGQSATITDAHILRGTLQPDSLLGGEMHADVDAARAVFAPLAAQLGLEIVAAADSAIQVAEANIVRAIQQVSTERGFDPRHYTLVPFGGAGPMLAARLAEDLGLSTVLVPPKAGVMSAYGLLVSDYVQVETYTHRLTVEDDTVGEIRSVLATLIDTVTGRLQAQGLAGAPRFRLELEMRYAGQAFEIPVLLEAARVDDITTDGLISAFARAHRRVFEFDKGHAGACEVVTFRVSGAIAPASRPKLREAMTDGGPHNPADPGAGPMLEIVERGQTLACRRVARSHINAPIHGPALIEDVTSTLFVPPGWRGHVDAETNLILETVTDDRA